MGHRYCEIAFTPSVNAQQTLHHSREHYARLQETADPHDRLGGREMEFIAARNSFYLASVSETGWPYVQHRGGPRGFLKVLDGRTLGFADFRGNKQYVSLGNLSQDNRVSLFFMDYANRRRLKIFGRTRWIDAARDLELIARLKDPDYPAHVERALVIDVEAFDWNCSQHITPRYSEEELSALLEPLQARVRELEARLKAKPSAPR